jgi:hypothetical protein
LDHSTGNRPTVVINLLSSFSGGAITYANRAVPLIVRKLDHVYGLTFGGEVQLLDRSG